MNKDFEQISIKPGFMKHNGGLLFKTISENEYEFKTVITEIILMQLALLTVALYLRWLMPEQAQQLTGQLVTVHA